MNSIDAAWAAVEAALPKGYRLAALSQLLPDDERTYRALRYGRNVWEAEASLAEDERWVGGAGSYYGWGNTVAEALADLTEHLKDGPQ